MTTSQLQEVEVELRRVCDRLNSLPLSRAATSTAACRAAADVILIETRGLTDAIPVDASLPELAPQGLGALMAVVGRDYLDAARASRDPDVSPVRDALVTLRRALP